VTSVEKEGPFREESLKKAYSGVRAVEDKSDTCGDIPDDLGRLASSSASPCLKRLSFRLLMEPNARLVLEYVVV
jgi:hypothetical protein